MSGKVLSIHIATAAGAPMEERDRIDVIAGEGIDGEHHRASGAGRRHVTLIESEAVEAVARDYGIRLKPGESRRNVLTEGVALNHLIYRTFRLGGTVLRGVELCEPCGYLEKVTGRKIREPLIHRGGLCAEVLESGAIAVGDTLTLDD